MPTTALERRRSLLAWFKRHAREMPWRRTKDPYRVWLSEIMLQQTRVDTVIPYYDRFLAAFPSVQALAAAPEDQVLKLWEGLGYYRRARHLHRAAKMVAGEWEGQFPENAEGWRQLPGIGPYTAGAIASIAFNEPVPLVDGNVKRVLARAYGIDAPIDFPATTVRCWEIAAGLVPKKNPGDFNQALMELGATVCLPRHPRCDACSWRVFCVAWGQGRQEEIPVQRPRSKVPHYPVVAAALERDGKWLLAQRPHEAMLGGLWEFPGGKVRPGETPAVALRRALREKCGLAVTVGPLVATVRHAYSHFSITLQVYRCRGGQGKPVGTAYAALAWAGTRELDTFALPTSTRKALRGMTTSSGDSGNGIWPS